MTPRSHVDGDIIRNIKRLSSNRTYLFSFSAGRWLVFLFLHAFGVRMTISTLDARCLLPLKPFGFLSLPLFFDCWNDM